jgi:hypothetical protein
MCNIPIVLYIFSRIIHWKKNIYSLRSKISAGNLVQNDRHLFLIRGSEYLFRSLTCHIIWLWSLKKTLYSFRYTSCHLSITRYNWSWPKSIFLMMFLDFAPYIAATIDRHPSCDARPPCKQS